MPHLPICVTGCAVPVLSVAANGNPVSDCWWPHILKAFLLNASLSTSGYLPYIMLQLVFFSAVGLLFVCVCFVYHVVLTPCGWSGTSESQQQSQSALSFWVMCFLATGPQPLQADSGLSPGRSPFSANREQPRLFVIRCHVTKALSNIAAIVLASHSEYSCSLLAVRWNQILSTLPEFRRKLLICPAAFPTGLAWPEMTFVEQPKGTCCFRNGKGRGCLLRRDSECFSCPIRTKTRAGRICSSDSSTPRFSTVLMTIVYWFAFVQESIWYANHGIGKCVPPAG